MGTWFLASPVEIEDGCDVRSHEGRLLPRLPHTKDIKGAYKQHELLSETTNFVRELEPKVEACHKLAVKLLKMHSEAIKDE